MKLRLAKREFRISENSENLMGANRKIIMVLEKNKNNIKFICKETEFRHIIGSHNAQARCFLTCLNLQSYIEHYLQKRIKIIITINIKNCNCLFISECYKCTLN